MNVPVWVWTVTVAVIVAMLAVDFVGHARTPHAPSLRESAWWSAAYVAIALVFGLVVWAGWRGEYAGEYFAGYITEKSLSVDNLFVFVLIMSTFRVPRLLQQKVLLLGIAIALVLRTIFIFAGAALIENFSWLFYLFGAFLLWTAWSQLRHAQDESEEFHENALLRLVRRVFPVTDDFGDGRMLVRKAGRWFITPMLVVMIAIGSADLLFAVDSIPAIFGLTQQVFLVFAANAFALLGLRQLYFLLDGLLDRLVYLAYGLAAILAFIGVKLVLHALHTNELPFVNGGEPFHVPEISTALSLAFIVVVLVLTTVLSLWADGRRASAGDENGRDTDDAAHDSVR